MSVREEIVDAFAGLRAAILAKDEQELWAIHDPDFQATELHGAIVSASEHIAAVMEGGELEMEFIDLTAAQIAPDIAAAWGKQTLRGVLRPEDLGAQVSSDVADGVLFVLTAIWRRTEGRWRILTYHVSIPLASPDATEG
jgi:hypothetical protein